MDHLDDHKHTYSLILGSNPARATVPAGATNYLAPFGTALLVSTNPYASAFPIGGTLRNLCVQIFTAQPADGSLVVTVQVDGTSTALTLTIAAGSAAGKYYDTAHTVAFTANTAVRFKIVNNSPTLPCGELSTFTIELYVIPTT
jgi:hypothetical protein